VPATRPEYVHGHGEHEILGTGTSRVAMLPAELVGPTGHMVAVAAALGAPVPPSTRRIGAA